MFDELRQLYQEVILDHGTRPRNHHALADATCRANGSNPVCGDMLTVYLKLAPDGTVADAAFEGKGCAISVASASLMTELVKGRTVAAVEKLFQSFHRLCTEDGFVLDDEEDDADRLNVLAGVREFPVRVKCATLAWHTMRAALGGEAQTSTE
jgi:nitrogen fixation protein NifU and related proteins